MQLARQMELPEVIDYLDYYVARKNQSLDDLEKALYSETMHALINALKDLEPSVEMYHSNRFGQWIDFGKTETFEIGLDSLTVKPYCKPGVYQEHGTYTVTSMPNSEVDTSQENVNLKETLELIEQFYG